MTEDKKELRKITAEELRVHNKSGDGNKIQDDIWVMVNGKVYDLSKFYRKHPGGPELIEEYAGKDGTKSFKEAGHPASAKKEMEEYLVGEYVQPREFKKLEEIADHNQPGDLWLLIHNKVYDCSKFKHPGK
jgi:cytochrome b involved in lipid metabolism